MIPTRSTFASWRIGELAGTGADIGNESSRVHGLVKSSERDLIGIIANHGWSGQSAPAARDSFGRLERYANRISEAGGDMQSVLERGSEKLLHLKRSTDSLIATIESGPLSVSNEWVILIKPGEMTQNMAKLMRLAAEEFQKQLNPMVSGIGDADHYLATGLAEAIESNFANALMGAMDPRTTGAPFDEVPDPETEEGRQHQKAVRAQDMATNVIGKTVTDDGNRKVTTYTMQDGSRQVVTHIDDTKGTPENRLFGFSCVTCQVPTPLDKVETFDPDGNLVAYTKSGFGRVQSGIKMADGWASVDIYSDGKKTLTYQGKTGPLPEGASSSFFTHPTATTVGGAVTALESATSEGKPVRVNIPEMEKVNAGAKFAGPALSIGTAIYDVVAASNDQERCVALFSGSAGVVGGVAGGSIGGGMMGPPGAFVGSMAGGWVAGAIGATIGESVCK